ncbi:MAG: vitamin K epoxide reductase family protein [Microbacteriaceae bacterium]
MVPSIQPRKRPTVLAIFLIVAGAIGFYAAWALTLDKFQALTHPGGTLGCDFSLIVQCKANLNSPQGAVFGFPNPLLGLAGFVAPIAVGAGILAGARFARWFWLLFNLGLAGALAFVVWLIGQSIYVLGTLCPWCMVVWSVTIPLFLAVTLYNLSTGTLPAGRRLRRLGKAAYGWVPLITVLCYILVAVLAQLRLDVTGHLIL